MCIENKRLFMKNNVNLSCSIRNKDPRDMRNVRIRLGTKKLWYTATDVTK